MRRLEDEARFSLLHVSGAIREASALRISASGHTTLPEQCWVMEEQALFIEIVDAGTERAKR